MSIFTQVILPVLLVVGIGALIQRRFGMHIPTLSRLTVYLLVPAFLFVKIYHSTLGWLQIGGIMLTVLLPMAVIGFPFMFALRRAKVPGETAGAVVLGALIFNAGNIGIPVANFFYNAKGPIFPGMQHAGDGEAVQALIVMGSNISIWLIGYAVLALAKGDGMRGVAGFFKLPMVYVIAAAFLFRALIPPESLTPKMLADGAVMPLGIGAICFKPVLHLVDLIADATVPVMLLTLGGQLAQNARWPNWRWLTPVLVVKLLLLPVATAGLVIALGMWPWPGAQLVIASAAPTAINTLLLSIEVDADADTAADCVFWTTLFSAITLTATLAIVTAVAGQA